MTLYLYRVENIKTHENTCIEVFDRLEVGVVIGWKLLVPDDDSYHRMKMNWEES